MREALNKKSIRPEDAVQKVLEEIAQDIAIIEPDPVDWGWWVNCLVGELEDEATKRGKNKEFETMLVELKQSFGD